MNMQSKCDQVQKPKTEHIFKCTCISALYACITKNLLFYTFQDAYKEAEADLFKSSSKGKGKKRRKDVNLDSDEEGDGDEEDAFFRSLAAQDKIPKYVELLKFKVRAY